MDHPEEDIPPPAAGAGESGMAARDEPMTGEPETESPAEAVAGEGGADAGTADVEASEVEAADAEARLRELEEALARETARAEQNRNDYLRAVADMDNLRKRTGREKENVRKFALEGFSRELLTLADNVARALSAIRTGVDENPEGSEAMKPLVDGVEMIERELQAIFGRHGIESIEALGKPFDPHFHQAITQVEEHDAESGTVLAELQTGYILNGRLLRPSLVNVAK